MGERSNVAAGELFVGRMVECAALERALGAGERLISIVGPSGMGKTRLAREVASRLQPAFEGGGGVYFCDLSAARARDDLLSSVAVTLGIASGQGGEAALAHAIANRGRLLLVLDNFEYLEEQALSLVADWLGQAPGLQLIVTSLARLGLDGESFFELGPLEPEDAIDLYVERARRAWARGRSFFSGERRAIDGLVRRLDRLPLAIELAAARVRVLPPREMLSRIDERFELLRTRRDGRRSSLEEAISCSWELLEAAERQILAHSSIFEGGFTLEAAEEVFALEGDGPQPGVLEVLESLRDKALLQLDDSDPPRFSLYESVGAFASRERAGMGGEAALARRHSRYFLETGERWVDRCETSDRSAAIDWLEANRENLLAVYRRHLETEPALAARAGLVASVALYRTGSPAAQANLAEGAVGAARRANDPLLLAKALHSRFGVLRPHGRLEDCRRDIDEGLEILGRIDAPDLEGYLWTDSAALRWHEGDSAGARADLERAIELERRVDEPALGGHIQMTLGIVADADGQAELAQAAFERACAIFRKLGNYRYLARGLYNLGVLLSKREESGRVRTVLEEARHFFRLARDVSSEAALLLATGSIELVAGNLDEAEPLLQAALPILRSFGNRGWEGLALVNLGVVALEREEALVARQRLQDALVILRAVGDQRMIRHVLPFYAAVNALLGPAEEAEADFAAARSAAQGDEPSQAIVEILEGFLDLARARSALQELRPDDAAPWVARASRRLERELSSAHGIASAKRLLERALVRHWDWTAAQPDVSGEAERGPPNGSQAELRSQPRVGSARSGELLLGSDAAWFELSGAPRVMLGRRVALRRLLMALSEQRILAPGVGLDLERLSEIGWPGESVHPDAASNRVYCTVRDLRKAGLGEALLHHADGYLLDPSLVVTRVAS